MNTGRVLNGKELLFGDIIQGKNTIACVITYRADIGEVYTTPIRAKRQTDINGTIIQSKIDYGRSCCSLDEVLAAHSDIEVLGNLLVVDDSDFRMIGMPYNLEDEWENIGT